MALKRGRIQPRSGFTEHPVAGNQQWQPLILWYMVLRLSSVQQWTTYERKMGKFIRLLA